MGCHTWFHRKIDGPSPEEVRDDLVKYFKESISFYDILEKSPEKIDEDYNWIFEAVTPEQITAERDELLFLYKLLVSGEMTELHSYELWCSFSTSQTRYVDGKGWFCYEGEDLPHDLFRIGDYPGDLLFSLDETMTFIENKNCTTYDNTNELLEKFWKNFPEGLISFG